jgi:hypothetical protein
MQTKTDTRTDQEILAQLRTESELQALEDTLALLRRLKVKLQADLAQMERQHG